MSHSNQFQLLRQRRFLPFFLTQFLGAFNDNFFKQAYVILVTTQGLSLAGMDGSTLAFLAGAFFMAAYFPFSALAGQLADKYEKGRLISAIKVLEVVIMIVATAGLITLNVPILLGALFLMGVQSALFSPLKYAILPQHLYSQELIGGNGMVEMGTFVAILLGMVAGGLLIGIEQGALVVGVVAIVLAVIGCLTARQIPHSPAPNPTVKLNFNLVSTTWRLYREARANKPIYRLVIALSWFWAFGSLLVAQFPAWTDGQIWADGKVITLMLCAFTVGIGIGSLLCERLSAGAINIKLGLVGLCGITLFSLGIYAVNVTNPDYMQVLSAVGSDGDKLAVALETLPRASISRFLALDNAYLLLGLITLLGLCLGLFGVPIHAMLQHQTSDEERNRMLAANNIVNAWYVVLTIVGALMLRGMAGLTIAELFLLAAVVNTVILYWAWRRIR